MMMGIGCVYVFVNDLMPNIIKIGASEHIDNRLASANTDVFRVGEFRIHSAHEHRYYRHLERLVHTKMQDLRFDGEFFVSTPTHADNVIVHAAEEIDRNQKQTAEEEGERFFYDSSVSDLGKAIRQARLVNKMTLDQLSLVSGIGRRCIADIEHGKTTSQVGIVFHLMSVLKLNLYHSISSSDTCVTDEIFINP